MSNVVCGVGREINIAIAILLLHPLPSYQIKFCEAKGSALFLYDRSGRPARALVLKLSTMCDWLEHPGSTVKAASKVAAHVRSGAKHDGHNGPE